MKSAIRWAITNTPAMNTLMISVLAVGLLSLVTLRREVFPEFDLEILTVMVPYPGATPEEIEEGICQKIEEAVRSINGIKKQTAVAQEGAGTLVLELETGVDPQRVLSEVRSEVDRISTFPLLAEDPEVQQITLRQPAIQVGLIGPDLDTADAEWELRDLAEEIRDDLLRLPAVSQAEIVGAKDYQIDIEIPEGTLRRHGLTLQEVARIVRRQNLELPGGLLRTESQDILIRGKNKRLVGEEIAKIPLVTQPNGVVLTVDDLGTVRDEFTDVTSETRVEGRPAMVISVERTSSEDLLAMTDAVLRFVEQRELPPGYEMITWEDRSVEVRERLALLTKNGLMGLALVVFVLASFLELRLALWVALGIPISLLGAAAILWATGQTLNMLTTFTFLMALGIVVDDAIVVGENIYTHRQRGVGFLRAAIDGTIEVLPSVAASIATTVVAFMPLLFVSGIMGKFIAVMPITMISILIISLFEAGLILPCHLAHESRNVGLVGRVRAIRNNMSAPMRWTLGSLALGLAVVVAFFWYPFYKLGGVFHWVTDHVERGLERFTERIYTPVLRFSLNNPTIAASTGATLLLLAVGLVAGGVVPFVIFPKLDSKTIEASITYPDGTAASITDAATRRLEAAIQQVGREFADQGTPVLRLTRRGVGYVTAETAPGHMETSSGGHIGSVTAELTDVSQREVNSEQVLARWREVAGEFVGAENIGFESTMRGPGGVPIEFKLLAKPEDVASLEAAVEKAKAKLHEFPGVFDISDDSSPGKWEFQLRLKDDAEAMGVPLAEVAETVRAAFYGEEVMRLQRGRHEVKLMVRYPREDRRSLANFNQIHIRTGDGAERPVTELAEVQVEQGYSEINRVDQLRSVTVSADVDESQANAREIVALLRNSFMPEMLAEYRGVSVRWEGQQEQTEESVNSLLLGLLVALVAIFALLTLEFRSYFQPVLIMAAIPFGLVGAVAGHALMGLPLTLFSLFGLVALTGVVVNDSIVLIDFINHRVRDGMPLMDALVESGRRRLRPVLLTSLTTIGGLLPLVLERSFQAQVLIPMAVSLCFGLMLTTLLVLLLVPTFYLAYARLTALMDAPIEQAAGAVVEATPSAADPEWVVNAEVVQQECR